MKLTIIADDKLVSKDGVGYSGLPLKDFPSDVWAVQWDGSKGTVEKRDLSVTEITDITPYNAWITEWETEYGDPTKYGPTSADTNSANLSLAEFREWRNQLLTESDWTVLPDSTLSADKQAEWKVYRQKLRDLPANTSEPYRVDIRSDIPS